jgi:hypothetical protein
MQRAAGSASHPDPAAHRGQSSHEPLTSSIFDGIKMPDILFIVRLVDVALHDPNRGTLCVCDRKQ